MSELFSATHVLIILLVAFAFFGGGNLKPRPPIHPVPADDSRLLRLLRLLHVK